MLGNDLKSALRGILYRKTFSFLNGLGLAVGMGAVLLILHYSAFETSFDDFHVNKDRIYRLRGGERADGSAAAGAAVAVAFPEVRAFAKLAPTGSRGVYADGEIFYQENKTYSATASFLEIFSFPMRQGNPRTALADPGSIVITASTARRYFGDADPMGRTLLHNGRWEYVVTGVLEDVPANSHLDFDILLSWATVRQRYGARVDESWIIWGMYSYLLLEPDADPAALQAKLDEFVRAKQKEVDRPESFWETYHLQPLADIHLHSHFVYEARENGSGRAVSFLLLAALLIILIAWANTINLSTARAADRAREVGIRKAVGAGRVQLVRRFLLESLFLNLAGIALALILVETALPTFSRFSGIPPVGLFDQPLLFWAGVIVFITAGALVSGLYPAFLLSSFPPGPILRERSTPKSRGAVLRKALVVFQFMISTALIAATITIWNQIGFMTNTDLGVDTDRTLVVRRPLVLEVKTREDLASRIEAFETDLARIPGIEALARSTYVPGDDVHMINEGQRADLSKDATIDVYEIIVDENFIGLFGLKMRAGRNFSPSFSTDTDAVILNDTARRQLGWESPEAAIDRKFIYRTEYPLKVIGVLADYHQESLKTPFEPMILRFQPGINGHTAIRMRGGDPAGRIARIRRVWDLHYPGNPFEFFFLDDHYLALYGSDRVFLRMFGLFALLAIFVAGLGISGLSLFNAAQRTREIGIRRVLGASSIRILGLLARDFARLILLSLLISLPLTYIGMRAWLERYPFRISIGWWFFLAPAGLILLVSGLVIGRHALKAAGADPVEALRYE